MTQILRNYPPSWIGSQYHDSFSGIFGQLYLSVILICTTTKTMVSKSVLPPPQLPEVYQISESKTWGDGSQMLKKYILLNTFLPQSSDSSAVSHMLIVKVIHVHLCLSRAGGICIGVHNTCDQSGADNLGTLVFCLGLISFLPRVFP